MKKPEMVADCECSIGENPLWHPQEQCVYWTDIPRGRLYRYSPQTGKHEPCYTGAPVGGFTIQADGGLLLFMARGAIARWRDGKLDVVVKDIPDERDSRFNDVIADPAGRVFCGTMSTRTRLGRLYRLDTDGSLHIVQEGVGTSNGLGFTPDRRILYYTDSRAGTIDQYDYDAATGAISRRRPWVRVSDGEGVPDGMTVDAEGHVWSAHWDGSALYRYSPDGVEELRIAFPARKVSCPTFGGKDYGDLYVTTALNDGTRATEGAGAGALFRLRPGVRGVPEFVSRVGL